MTVLENLKIAYISDQHYPIEKADSEQVINTVSALAAEGMDIQLVIPRAWRNLRMSKAARRQKLRDFYNVDVLDIIELLHVPLSSLRLEKYAHGIVAPLWVKWSGYQIVYTRNPLPAFVASIVGMKVIYETYRVFEPSNFVLAKWLARKTFSKHLLGIIVHSQPTKDSLLKFGALGKKVAVIHNGYNPDLFSMNLTKAQARQTIDWPAEQKLACFVGRLDKEKGIAALIELARRTPEIGFLLIGKSQKDSDGWIERLAAKKEVTNLRCLPWMNVEQLRYYLYAADVLLIPPTAAPLHKHGKTVLPMKVFQYLASGRPILAPRLADSAEILNPRNAVLVEPDNWEEAAQAVRRIFSEPNWSESLANQAKIDSQHYTWERRAQKIISFLNERLNDDGHQL